MDHRKKKQELLALDQSSPYASLAESLKRRFIPSRFLATQVPHAIHNNVYINNLQEIAEASGDFVASVLENDNIAATSIRPRWSTDSHLPMELLLKVVDQLLVKTKIGSHFGPDSLTLAQFPPGGIDISVSLAKHPQFVRSMPRLPFTVKNFRGYRRSQG